MSLIKKDSIEVYNKNIEVLLKLYSSLEEYLDRGDVQEVVQLSAAIQRLLVQV